MSGIRHFTASAVVLDGQDRVLLVRHRKLGLWLYPGGHIDSNEDPAQAALREVREETGVHATVVGEPVFAHPAVLSHHAPWTIIEMAVTDPKIGAHQHIDLVYVCRACRGDLVPQLDEVSAARWVPIADVAAMPTPADLPALITAAACWAKPYV